MKKRIADRWVKALRSGEYKQGKNALNIDGKFCCLGVLCDLAVKSRILKKDMLEKIDDGDNILIQYQEECELLPEVVQSWAGMATSNGRIEGKMPLTDRNDKGHSFKEIATYIEKNYKEL